MESLCKLLQTRREQVCTWRTARVTLVMEGLECSELLVEQAKCSEANQLEGRCTCECNPVRAHVPPAVLTPERIATDTKNGLTGHLKKLLGGHDWNGLITHDQEPLSAAVLLQRLGEHEQLVGVGMHVSGGLVESPPSTLAIEPAIFKDQRTGGG